MNTILIDELYASVYVFIRNVMLPLVDSLGINDDLKTKLQDVLIPERLLTLGHMLGKGKHFHLTCPSISIYRRVFCTEEPCWLNRLAPKHTEVWLENFVY